MAGICALIAGSGGTSVHTVTNGERVTYPPGGEFNTWGYTSLIGSIDPPTFSRTSTPITLLAVFGNFGIPQSMSFAITGGYPQGLFNSLKVGGDTYTSMSASFSTNGSASTWTWATSTNYFAGTGGTTQVVFV